MLVTWNSAVRICENEPREPHSSRRKLCWPREDWLANFKRETSMIESLRAISEVTGSGDAPEKSGLMAVSRAPVACAELRSSELQALRIRAIRASYFSVENPSKPGGTLLKIASTAPSERYCGWISSSLARERSCPSRSGRKRAKPRPAGRKASDAAGQYWTRNLRRLRLTEGDFFPGKVSVLLSSMTSNGSRRTVDRASVRCAGCLGMRPSSRSPAVSWPCS